MDSAIAKSPGLPQNTTLYRGIKSAEGDFGFENLKPGSVLIDQAFVSTSADRGLSENWFLGTNSAYMMKIQAPKGTKGLVVHSVTNDSRYANEFEYLLPRNSKFEVLSVDATSRVIELKVKG
jgi:hypothetical protein